MLFPTTISHGPSLLQQRGTPIGQQKPFSAHEILYHHLNITYVQTTGPLSKMQYSYTYESDSGISSNTNISDFLSNLKDNNTGSMSSLYNPTNDGAPTIIVKKSCYVIIRLSGFVNLRFEPGIGAIDTKLDNSDEYVGLTHIDANWQPTADISSRTSPTTLAYFGVINPVSNRDDGFTLYFQFDQNSGEIDFGQIDPAIKNRGGNDRSII